MVKIIKTGIIVTLLFIKVGACKAQKKDYLNEEKFIKCFYMKYLTKMDSLKVKEALRTIHIYCTKSLVNRINTMRENYELSYDPFIKAQDFHISILDSIKIEKDPKDKGSYYVSYRYKNQSESERVYIEIEIIKTKEGFKINALGDIK